MTRVIRIESLCGGGIETARAFEVARKPFRVMMRPLRPPLATAIIVRTGF